MVVKWAYKNIVLVLDLLVFGRHQLTDGGAAIRGKDTDIQTN